MTDEQGMMLRLLRFSFWGEADSGELWTACDWTDVLRQAERQSIHGLVAKAIHSLNDHGAFGEVDEALAGRCLTTEFALLNSNMQVNGVLREVVQLLQADRQQPLLLKGQGVAQCYPIAGLRMAGDIDLYLDDVDRAVSLLRKHEPDCTFDDSCPRHSKMQLRGIDIELHRYLVDRQSGRIYQVVTRLQQEERSRSQAVSIDDVKVLTPSPLLNAFFLFQHFRQHFLHDSIGLRQVCDWMLYLHAHHHEIDVEQQRAALKESRLLYDWRCFGSIVVNYLGLPASEFPLYDGRHRLMSGWILRQILRFGHKGYVRRRKEIAEKGVRQTFRLLQTFTEPYLCNLVLCPRRGFAQLCYLYLSAIKCEALYWLLSKRMHAATSS